MSEVEIVRSDQMPPTITFAEIEVGDAFETPIGAIYRKTTDGRVYGYRSNHTVERNAILASTPVRRVDIQIIATYPEQE